MGIILFLRSLYSKFSSEVAGSDKSVDVFLLAEVVAVKLIVVVHVPIDVDVLVLRVVMVLLDVVGRTSFSRNHEDCCILHEELCA